MEELRNRGAGGPWITTGVKTAALVVILGVFVALVDQSVVERREAPTDAGTPTLAEQAPLAGFTLPPELRPNSGDVTAPPPTF